MAGLLIGGWLACIVAAAIVGAHKNAGWPAALITVFLGPVGLAVAFVLDLRPDPPLRNPAEVGESGADDWQHNVVDRRPPRPGRAIADDEAAGWVQ